MVFLKLLIEMKFRFLTSILYRYFNIVIDNTSIDQESIMRLSQVHLRTTRPKWKNKYLFIKLSYCSDRYRTIYGHSKFLELAGKILKELDVEEERSRRRISEQMTKFFKDN
jgi:hypothetical protein